MSIYLKSECERTNLEIMVKQNEVYEKSKQIFKKLRSNKSEETKKCLKLKKRELRY